MHFLQVNFAAVLTAAVIQWVLGWLWYGVLFKKSWLELVGQKEGGNCGRHNGVDLHCQPHPLFCACEDRDLDRLDDLCTRVSCRCSDWARLRGPAHVCTAHYREAAVQAVRHQCPLLADRHVFRRRRAGDLALAHHSQLLQATVDGLKWCFREPESPAAGLRRWGGSKRHQSPHFIRLPATEKMP